MSSTAQMAVSLRRASADSSSEYADLNGALASAGPLQWVSRMSTLAPRANISCDKLGVCAKEEAIMPALTLDEQLIFDVAVALKKVKIPGFRKGVVEEGRFEIAKTIVEYLKSNRWEFSKAPLQ